MTEATAPSPSAVRAVPGRDGGMEAVLGSNHLPPSLAWCLGCWSETTDKTYIGGWWGWGGFLALLSLGGDQGCGTDRGGGEQLPCAQGLAQSWEEAAGQMEMVLVTL